MKFLVIKLKAFKTQIQKNSDKKEINENEEMTNIK